MARADTIEDSESDYEPEEVKRAQKQPTKKASTGVPKAKPGALKEIGHDGQAVEDIYVKKTPIEHVLLRPDTYVGSTEEVSQNLFVVSPLEGEIKQKQTSFVPGLYKIFDEVLVNAADNKVRDSKMKNLSVDIDRDNGLIRVYNDGAGIPVEIHKEHGVYVPELIFGHLLTSSNYDDSQRKVTGGRNGYGAKLANIFSTEFIVETADGERKKQYRQVFQKNMSQMLEPTIKTCKATENWTQITFRPDLERFGVDRLTDDMVSLMSKRVYDIAGTIGKGMKITLNGKKLPIKGFSDYVDLFLKPKEKPKEKEGKEDNEDDESYNEDTISKKENAPPKIYERINDRWEVCISLSEGQMSNVSFVNSINTSKGGTHVNYIADQVAAKLIEKLKTGKNKASNVKPLHVKNHLFIFVNCLIENPAFDSQTKETLTTKQSNFGSKAEISDKMVNDIMKTQIKDNILSFASFKQSKELKKSDGAKRNRLTGIPKLDDANDAGTKKSEECTLILTEGDSAKALAVAGLSVLGRDKYGVFPLRGKLLNVKDATHQQVMNNTEIANLKQILGLQHGKTYNDAKPLRYGHLMIMTDQDHDGSHIKGLLINFFHHFFPSLLKVKGFLLEFITPIVKATKRNELKVFYTMPEYEAWRESLGGTTQGWQVKYYKGLGTSTSAEAKEYFAAILQHRKKFKWNGNGEDDDIIDLAFSKKKAENRKQWMNSHDNGTFLDHSVLEIKYTDFINKELILFSLADVQRSIPSMVDGLKVSQRKVLYGAFKRKLKADIKVAQLSGYVSEHSAYHHGEQSLASTIVSLAQNFVGSNNISLLYPSGQFGTRLQGGKDHASPRYIFTRLGRLTRNIFLESDERILNYLYDDGQLIEPSYYLPVLPMCLINGAEGIGTGWSTFIPNYNPREVALNILNLLNGEELSQMVPWYNGFTGSITEVEKSAKAKDTGASVFLATGIVTKRDDNTLDITELPIRTWTQDYKEFLETLVKPEKGEAMIEDYREHHTDTRVHFVLYLTEKQMDDAEKEGLEKRFKLQGRLSTSNMNLFNENGTITKYTSPLNIIESFYSVRIDGYKRRHALLVSNAEYQLERISNKVRFIFAVIDGEIEVSRRKKNELEKELDSKGYTRLSKKGNALTVDDSNNNDDEGDGDENGENDESGNAPQKGGKQKEKGNFDYLLDMPIHSLTYEKVNQLVSEKEENENKLSQLKSTTASELWKQDINEFLAEYDKVLEEEEKERANERKPKQSNARGKGKATTTTKKAPAKKNKKDNKEEFSPTKKKAATGTATAKKEQEGKTAKAIESKPSSNQQAKATTSKSNNEVNEEKGTTSANGNGSNEAEGDEFGSLLDKMAQRFKTTESTDEPGTSTQEPRSNLNQGKKREILQSKSSNDKNEKLAPQVKKQKASATSSAGGEEANKDETEGRAPSRRGAGRPRPTYTYRDEEDEEEDGEGEEAESDASASSIEDDGDDDDDD